MGFSTKERAALQAVSNGLGEGVAAQFAQNSPDALLLGLPRVEAFSQVTQDGRMVVELIARDGDPHAKTAVDVLYAAVNGLEDNSLQQHVSVLTSAEVPTSIVDSEALVLDVSAVGIAALRGIVPIEALPPIA